MSRSTRNAKALEPQHGLDRIAYPLDAPLMTRRAALKALLGLSVATTGLFGAPLSSFAAEASKETTEALAAAEEQLEEAQAQLDAITDEFVALNQELNETVTQIEQVQANIDDTQAKIDAKQAEIEAKQAEIEAKQAEIEEMQDQLADRVSEGYKTGNSDFLSVLLNSASFEELTNNLFYLGKINASDEELIAGVKQAKAELEATKTELEEAKAELEEAKAELEEDKTELEELKAAQGEQLLAVQTKQEEASALVAGLDDSVKELMAQRDAEILAAAEEERRQAEAAAAAASGTGGAGVTGTLSNASASEKGAAIVAACSQVASPGSGLCAMWVSRVYAKAGLGYPGGNANNMYWNFCTSSDKSTLEPGMIVAVSTHPHTSAGRTYGHVGIYVGNSTVMDNIGYIRTIGLDSWISYYGTTVTPRWGWAA